MARTSTRLRHAAITVLAWGIALWMFFPILWMFLTGFKSEPDALSTPPHFFFRPTLSSYQDVFARENYWHFATNSVVISVMATVVALLVSIPAAYAMAFLPGPRTRMTLLWMLSTRMLPSVGVLVPIYLLARATSLLDSRTGLIVIYMLTNLPITVWMLYTFFQGSAGRHTGSRAHGRGDTLAGSNTGAYAAGAAGHCLDRAAFPDPVLE